MPVNGVRYHGLGNQLDIAAVPRQNHVLLLGMSLGDDDDRKRLDGSPLPAYSVHQAHGIESRSKEFLNSDASI